MNRAAIDIGSNSLLLTIVDQAGATLHDEARVVGLGRGLGDNGVFLPDRMAAAEEVLAAYVATARTHGVEPWSIQAVATSGARRAMNAQTWLSRLQRDHGLRVRIISGDEEARLAWIGALRDLTLPEGPLLVVDLGGGSTEIVLGEGATIHRRVSLEIGSVRLTEAYIGMGTYDPAALARLKNHVDVALASLVFDPAPKTVVGVAGTVTTLAAMAQGLEKYEAARVHGSRLERVQLAKCVDQLMQAGPDERKKIAAVSPERADYLVAGATVLEAVLGACRRPSLVASDRGLRFGVLAASGG